MRPDPHNTESREFKAIPLNLQCATRSLSSLAPALRELGLAERLSSNPNCFGELCFDGLPLLRLQVRVSSAPRATIKGFAVKPGDGLEVLTAAIVANDIEARFLVSWHDGWPLVAGCGTATIAGGVGESTPCPEAGKGVHP